MPSRKTRLSGSWVQQDTPKVGDGSAFQSGTLNYYDGSSWVSIGGSSGGMSLVEGFESGDLSAYSGDVGAGSIITTAYEGSYALEVSDTGEVALTRTNLTFGQGDNLELYAQEGVMFFIGVQSAVGRSSLSGYKLEVVEGTGKLKIWRVDDGTQTELAVTDTVAYSTDWFKFTTDWATDGTITISSNQTSNTCSATDTTYTTGGIGWGVYSATVRYDSLYW